LKLKIDRKTMKNRKFTNVFFLLINQPIMVISQNTQNNTSSDPKKSAIGFFCTQKYQILGEGIAFDMLIGENEAEKFSQIWRALEKMKFILKSKQIKLDLPTFCYF
jgi:hypothetical protein